MRALERWREVLRVTQSAPSPPFPLVGHSVINVGLTVGSTPALWNGPSLPPEYPQGSFLHVVTNTGIELSLDGATWTAYSAGQTLPISGNIREARFQLKNGSVIIYIQFAAPPAPSTPWYQGVDVGTFAWERGTPSWWQEQEGETRLFWAALFQPANLAEYVASRAVLLVDPSTAPDLDALQNLISPVEGAKVRPLITETLFRRLLARLYLALRYRGTPLLGGALSPLFGGMDIYWHVSIPNRRTVVYSGGAPLQAVKTILRRLLPAHVEIEMVAYLSFPPQVGNVWEGVSWTFSERQDVSLC